MDKKVPIFICLFLVFLFLVFSVCLHAQSPVLVGSESSIIATGTNQPETSVASIIPKFSILEDEFKKLPEKLNALVASSSLNESIGVTKGKLNEVRIRLDEFKNSGIYSFDKVSELRVKARENLALTNEVLNQISAKIKSIEALRQYWETEKANWKTLEAAQDKNAEEVKKVFANTDKMLKSALKMLSGAEDPLVSFQKKISDLATECQKQLDEIDKLIILMRKDLFRRSRPALFTRTFANQFFDIGLWNDFWVGIASLSLPTDQFFSSQGWILALQFFGFLFFMGLLKNVNIEKAKQINLEFLVTRKYSAAIVAGIAIFYPLFEEIPNAIKATLWSLATIGGARLIAGVVENPWRRRLIYLLSALFLTSQLCYLINLPSPMFRIYVALVGLIGAMFCFWRARVNARLGISNWFLIAIKAGGLVLLAIFILQAAGYAGLANHILEVSIKSVFLLLIVWIINLILKGLAEASIDNAFVKKSAIFKKHSAHIVSRVKPIIDILAIYCAVAGLLSVWGIFDSFSESSINLLSIGITLQGEKLTIGTLASAAALLYVSLFASWLIQRILDEEVYPRKKVEPGVGISINRLIHYTFVIIGIVVALSTIGIGLQSLAVLMGAFGIGIGFGLQNIVNNFASGLILLFERSIKVGDVVQINGEWGKIKNLGLRATVVETFSKSELIVPNSDLVSNTVTNWTLTDRQIRLIIPVGVAYGSDISLVTSVLTRVAQENPFVMKFPEPIVLFTGFGSSSLDFELRVYVSDIDNMLTLKNNINREIDRLFRENNIEIPFPQNDIHIRTMDEPFKKAIKELSNNA
ncbi:MAG: hypothetical protein Kow0029_24440 [Candidatus Rifleibacteriota bacterium]